MSEDKLKAIRARIDGLDEQIQALISERARCAQEVAAHKNGSDAARFYRPEREAEVLRRVIARNQGPLGGEEMARLFARSCRPVSRSSSRCASPISGPRVR